jgi:hypothetical protein
MRKQLLEVFKPQLDAVPGDWIYLRTYKSVNVAYYTAYKLNKSVGLDYAFTGRICSSGAGELWGQRRTTVNVI